MLQEGKMPMRILLVEDDAALREALAELLTREGYEAVSAAGAREAAEKLDDSIRLILLDVFLPDGDGVALCRSLREAGVRQPIIFLTAKDEEYDIVRGLDAGGNDYVTKPFRLQELLSRIRAQLRTAADPGKEKGKLRRGGILLDTERMQAVMDGEVLNLTLTEYKILQKLMEHRGIVTRAALLEALWDAEARYVDDNTLSVHVSRLREKIGADKFKTVRGVGYQWSDGS